jgi:hypothetical protein
MDKFIQLRTTAGADIGRTAYVNVRHIVDVRQDTTTATKILLNVGTAGSAAIQITHTADGSSTTSTEAAIRAAIEEAYGKNTDPRQYFPVTFPSNVTLYADATDAVIP